MDIVNNDIINTLDENTFEMLFKKHFKGLCYFSLTYVKDYEAAKEIVQDSYTALWEKRDTLDLSKSIKSYLTTTIYNKSLNYLRDNKKFNKDILDIESAIPSSGTYQPDRLGEAELKNKIENAINELPEKCREVFKLSRFEHLKYQEIADQLQISVKTVETHMSKALQHLRIRLSDYIAISFFILLWWFKNKF